MNHCCECFHWDEEKADKRGYAPCGAIPGDMLYDNDPNLALVEEVPCSCPRLLVRGDFGCVLFCARQTQHSRGKLPLVSDDASVSDVPVRSRT